jgi:iron complex outermembrane receptor protein
MALAGPPAIGPVFAQERARDGDVFVPTVTVVGQRDKEPLSEVLRPSDFVAPTPDAAALLRTVPGFSLSRIGGAVSDPALRGMNAARLQVLADDMNVEGACSHRMDPATSYLAAETFDRVTLTKGPSTVRYGAAVGGTVEFQRDRTRPAERERSLAARAQAGSFGQLQGGLDAQLASPTAVLRAYGTYAESDNYEDGDGNEVHSFYQRYNAGGSLALFPGSRSRLELAADTGDGQAAYPTFHMDGTRFRRDRGSARLAVDGSGGRFARAELRVSYADLDHRMDDYSLRPPHVTVTPFPGGSFVQTSLLNMDQPAQLGSVNGEAAWQLGKTTELLVGAGYGNDGYQGRNRTSVESCLVLGATQNCINAQRAWTQYDLKFVRTGAFAEISTWPTTRLRVKAGARADQVDTTAGELYDFNGLTALPGAFSSRRQTLLSGFMRLEAELGPGWNAFAAVGQAERAASYLEVASYGGFYLAPERNRQVDAGVAFATERLQVGVDAFFGQVHDYILTYQGTQSFNVDARTYGGEAYASLGLARRWRASTSLAWVRGDNLSYDRPLPQMPPPELRLGVEYAHERVTVGLGGRLVAAQNRVDVGYGTVTGVDLGPTPGFSVWNARAAFRVGTSASLALGVDNLFDRTYAEHLSRTGAFAPPGFVPTFRVNEPGRTFWVRFEAALR